MEQVRTLLLVFVLAASVLFVDGANVTIKQLDDIDENEMGMKTFFDIVDGFLGEVIQRKNISESFLNLSTIFVNGKLDEDSVTDWKEWAKYLTGYAVCGGLGVLFIVLMPITGLIFCCCRLCGRCGGRPKVNESKRGACKRRTYCTFLLVLNTFMLGGAICGFVCTSLLQEHLQNDDDQGTVGHMQAALGTFENFVDDSVNDISRFVNLKFDNISTAVLNQVNQSAQTAVDNVLKELRATELLDEARGISKDVSNIKANLDDVGFLLGNLTEDTEELEKNLTEIKSDIKTVCDKPANSNCNGLNLDSYEVGVDFTQLKKLKVEANNVAQTLDMSTYIEQAEQEIEKAKADASEGVEKQTADAKKAIADVKVEIRNGLDELRTQKTDAMKDVKSFREDLDDAEDDIRKYSNYIYYAGLGMCSVILLIVVLYYTGVLYGLCGERPGEGAPCCNTGTGASFLMAGVALTFILTWLLMIVCVILFLSGGPTFTEVCRYFDGHEPSKFKVFDDALTNGLDISDFYSNAPPDLSLVKTLRDCQANKAIFSALDLNYIVNLDDILSIEDLNKHIEDLKTSSVNIPKIDILNTELQQKLNDLATAGLNNINFTSYYEQLNKKLTSESLEKLGSQLLVLAGSMSDPADRTALSTSANRLIALETESVDPINNQMVTLNNTLKDLQGKSNINVAITDLITHLNTSETNFNKNKDTLVRDQITQLADSISKYTNTSIEDVKYQIRNNMLGCRALSDSLYTISDSVCVLVVRPVNGFWFSLGWCLFVSILCLIFAVLLASQYRREFEYAKDFEEPNYLMYGGPSPDTIPLTSLNSEKYLYP